MIYRSRVNWENQSRSRLKHSQQTKRWKENLGKPVKNYLKDIINFLHDPLACAIALGWNEGVVTSEIPLKLEIRDGWLYEEIDAKRKSNQGRDQNRWRQVQSGVASKRSPISKQPVMSPPMSPLEQSGSVSQSPKKHLVLAQEIFHGSNYRKKCRRECLAEEYLCHHAVRRGLGNAARQFYREVFGLPVVFEDNNSCVFKIGDTLINLLKTTAAGVLIEPATVASREAGSRLVFTIHVDDVDAMCAELTARGVELLNGPMDRPWGVRTASFIDPGGHIWEIAR